jgi:hypothetical protein
MFQSNRKLLIEDQSHQAEMRTISSIYGTRSSEIRELLTPTGQRRLTREFLKTFPKTMDFIPGLRKKKTKAMITAMVHGMAEDGNHFITCYGGDFHFYYRGTLIYKWDADENKGAPVNAGEYEDTPSTRNQRKEIEKAIENFNETVIKL